MPNLERPAELGYRWPAEWEPHAATWMAWPHNRETWPGIFERIPPQFARLVEVIAQSEPVHVLAGGERVMADAKQHVGHLDNVTLHDIETNDAWTRDHGPTFLKGPDPAIIDWQYNAWGGKYPPWDKDNAVPRQIAAELELRRFTPGLVLEGGAIETNGAGTILTTKSCLLNPNRNPTMTKSVVGRYLHEYLGADHILWLDGGEIAGDDTNGHIDQLARFVNEDTIVAATEPDPADENFEPLQRILRQLRSLKSKSGSAFNIINLPTPRPISHQGQRVPASYANFYIANQCVIVPQFDDEADKRILDVLTPLFPDREVVGQTALDLAWGLGAFHCLTQQMPASMT